MTDKEIIRALNVCVGIQNDCGECPLLEYSQQTDECMTELMSNALDLINRQQAEIEEARTGVKSYKGKYESAVKTAKELQTLVDELRHEKEVLIEDIHHSADQINEQIEEIERLSNSAKQWEDTAKDLFIGKEKQQAEIDRLTINMNAFGLGMKQEKERADTIKSEAIKEFWEKLWELDPEIISKVVSFDLDELNNLKKEVVGEQE